MPKHAQHGLWERFHIQSPQGHRKGRNLCGLKAPGAIASLAHHRATLQ